MKEGATSILNVHENISVNYPFVTLTIVKIGETWGRFKK